MKVIVVCGPTASGKTALSVELATKLCGAVVSADSMQVYKELNIGTAKPDESEKRGVCHYMLDVASVREEYSVSRYRQEASEYLDMLISRGIQPIVCGGTGLYIDALIRGGEFLKRDESGAERAALEEEWEKEGPDAMMERLKAIDPQSASRLHINDKKRIIRALEVYNLTGETITEHDRKSRKAPPRYQSVFIGVMPKDRQVLYDRINKRVDVMMERGLLNEVRELYEKGLLINTAAQAIGYKELFDYLEGRAGLEESVELIKRKSRNYAKRQITWFGRDERVFWIKYEKDEGLDLIIDKATKFLSENGVIL